MKHIRGITLNLDLSSDQRKLIEKQLSDALGSYIMGVEKTDFATWTPEEWGDMVGVAFDVVATQTFRQRVIVVPPFVEEAAPPF